MFRIRIVDSSPAQYIIDCEYEEGRNAAEHAREMNEHARGIGIATRYKVERIQSDESESWKARETARFACGEYMETPWDRQVWFRASPHYHLHFLHLSQKNPNRLAYTESGDKGIADSQTPIKPGRYLKKYFGDTLTESDIAMWSAKVSLLGHCDGFKIAKSEDEIERVYCAGPRSCMGYSADHYDSRVHPVRVYGDSDISLAYLERDESISARCLIWEANKVRSTIYGDGGTYADELKRLLEEAGYSRGTFNGATIQRIAHNPGFVLPYFDNAAGVNDCGDHLIISGNACEYEANNENGTSEEGYTCSDCGTNITEDEMYHSQHGDGPFCDSCYSDAYGMCEYCESETYCDNMNYVESAEMSVCDDCLSNNFVECEDCGEHHKLDDTVCLEPDSEIVCHSCFDSNHHTCEDCGDPYHKDNTIVHEESGNILCGDCYNTREEDDRQLQLDLESEEEEEESAPRLSPIQIVRRALECARIGIHSI